MRCRLGQTAVIFFTLFISAHAGEPSVAAAAAPQSPKLARLLAALDRNDQSALDAFWKDVEIEHTPLVEDIPNHPHEALFTFLVRADPADDAMNVRLGADFPMRTEHYTDSFERLGTSNVWFTSYVLPKASRILYRLRVPQGLTRSPSSEVRFTIDGVLYEHFLDPLNPRIFPEDPDPEHVDPPSSYYSGSEAPSSPYWQRRSDVPGGSLENVEIDSQALGGKRTVTVYTPANYEKNANRLPLILLFDGESYLATIPTPRILDNLIADAAIPPVVVAFVHSRGTRNEDLQPNANFQKFISAELLPWLRNRYRLSKDPKLNVVAGSSFGGLAAAYTAFMHPEIFGNVLSLSGSFWWSPNYAQSPSPSPNAGWMVKQFAESGPKPIRFYMSVGSWESAGALSANRILHSVLMGKSNLVTYREDPAGHNQGNFQVTLPEGLIILLGVKTSRR